MWPILFRFLDTRNSQLNIATINDAMYYCCNYYQHTLPLRHITNSILCDAIHYTITTIPYMASPSLYKHPLHGFTIVIQASPTWLHHPLHGFTIPYMASPSLYKYSLHAFTIAYMSSPSLYKHPLHGFTIAIQPSPTWPHHPLHGFTIAILQPFRAIICYTSADLKDKTRFRRQ